jgi:hypothetical protein
MTPRAATRHKVTSATADLDAAFRAGLAADAFAPAGSLAPSHLVNAVLEELNAGELFIAEAVDRRWHTVALLLDTEAVTSWRPIGEALGISGDQARSAYCTWVIEQWHRQGSPDDWPGEDVQSALASANNLGKALPALHLAARGAG